MRAGRGRAGAASAPDVLANADDASEPTHTLTHTIVPGMIKRRRSYFEHKPAPQVEYELTPVFWVVVALAAGWMLALSLSVVGMARENRRLTAQLAEITAPDPALAAAEQAVQPYIAAVRTRGQKIRRKLLAFPFVAYAVGVCAPYAASVAIFAPMIELFGKSVATAIKVLFPVLRKAQRGYIVVWWGLKARQVRVLKRANAAAPRPPVADGLDPALVLREAESIASGVQARFKRIASAVADRLKPAKAGPAHARPPR